eukprot:2652915-Rhodomonas_salina.1
MDSEFVPLVGTTIMMGQLSAHSVAMCHSGPAAACASSPQGPTRTRNLGFQSTEGLGFTTDRDQRARIVSASV